MRRRPIEPESMLIDCWGEKRRLIVDLLACLEKSGLDAFRLLVPGPVVESVSPIERARAVICGNVLGFEGKCINKIADLSGKVSKQRA